MEGGFIGGKGNTVRSVGGDGRWGKGRWEDKKW